MRVHLLPHQTFVLQVGAFRKHQIVPGCLCNCPLDKCNNDSCDLLPQDLVLGNRALPEAGKLTTEKIVDSSDRGVDAGPWLLRHIGENASSWGAPMEAISVKWVIKDNHVWQPSAKTCSYINPVSSCSDPKLESSHIVQMRKLSKRFFSLDIWSMPLRGLSWIG